MDIVTNWTSAQRHHVKRSGLKSVGRRSVRNFGVSGSWAKPTPTFAWPQ